MRRMQRVLTLISAAAVLAAGCHSASSAASSEPASGGAQAKPATYVGSPLGSQMTTATINDPSLNNMKAATLTIPA